MAKLVLLVITSVFLNPLWAQTISNDLFNKWENENRVECIIVMNDQLDLYDKTNGMTKDEKATYVYQSLKAHSAQSQRLLQLHIADKGIKHHSFFAFNGMQAWMTLDEAEYMASNFDIDRIIPNVQTRVERPYTNDEYIATMRTDAEWGIRQIKADTVWEMGIRGEGVIVAGQDTGYDYDNPAILTKYQGYSSDTVIHDYSWHDAIHELNPMHGDSDNDPANNPCGLDSTEPCDDHAHGSHTMGTMVGGNDTLKIGVAPDAKWIACRNMDRGYGSPVTYTECYEWFLAPTDINGQNPDPTRSPHVINNSWGCPPNEGCNLDNFFMMETVINNLTAAGTVVVVSAGNDGSSCGTISNPSAIFENSFAVGASREDDTKAGFSSIGPVLVDSSYRIKPDVVAPGVNVLSIDHQGGFNNWGGTSMAGPHVAGAVALIISANPDLAGQVDVIKDILKSTAVTLVDDAVCGDISSMDVPNFYYGYGRIDVLAAVEMAMNIPCSVDAGDDVILCHDLDESIDTLIGQLLTSNIVSHTWTTDPSISDLGNITYASDMLSDTTILNSEVGYLNDPKKTFYLTGTTSTGVTCVDSMDIYSTNWTYTSQEPISAIANGDSTGIYSIAESNWPSDYLWSPDYNISDITDRSPIVWNDTTQYYDLIVTDSMGCKVEIGWLVNVLTTSTYDPDQIIDINVASNPNQGDFTLSVSEGIISNLKLYDISGKLISVTKSSSDMIAIEGLDSGTYFYIANVGDKLSVGKILVIK